MHYTNEIGYQFRFNDMVECTMTLLPRDKTVGRLIQIRKGKGQFGSDQYLIRRADGTLGFFENVGLRHTSDVVPVCEDDCTTAEYTHQGGLYPEAGFLIANPSQPDAPPTAFGLTISNG